PPIVEKPIAKPIDPPPPPPAPVETASAPTPQVESDPILDPPPIAVDKPDQTIEEKLAARRSKSQTSTPAPKKSQVADAILRVDEADNREVQLQIGSQLREPPRARFQLSAGTYTLRVKSGVSRFTCQVTLESGKLTSVKVYAADRVCETE